MKLTLEPTIEGDLMHSTSVIVRVKNEEQWKLFFGRLFNQNGKTFASNPNLLSSIAEQAKKSNFDDHTWSVYIEKLCGYKIETAN